ncbi:MAG: hypothetical protein AAGJ70_01820 [Pseudomonadota bacterium]
MLTSPLIVDLILGLVAIEIVVLSLWLGRRSELFAPLPVIANAMAGIGILIALKGALAGSPWPWVPTGLTLSLVAHLSDLALRWRYASTAQNTGTEE